MNKRKVRELLSLYIDNELTTQEKQHVEENIRLHDEWQQEYKALKSLQDTLQSLPRISVHESFLVDLHTEIERINNASSRRIITLPRLMKCAAAAVIVLALLFSYKSYVRDNNVPQRTDAPQENAQEMLVVQSLEQPDTRTTEENLPKKQIEQPVQTVEQPSPDFTDEIVVFYKPNTTAPEVADARQGTSIKHKTVFHSDGSVKRVYNPAGVSSVTLQSDSEEYRLTLSRLEELLQSHNGYIVQKETQVQSIVKARVPVDSYQSFIMLLNETGTTNTMHSPHLSQDNISTVAADADKDNYITLKIVVDLSR